MWSKRIIFSLFMLVFFSTIIFNIFNLKTFALSGEFNIAGKPEYTKEKFIKAEYQDEYAEYLRTNFATRSEFIRLYNQIDFLFYNKIHAPGLVMGSGGELFEVGRIKPLYGEDFVSMFDVNSKMKMLDFVADTLNKLNKPLIILLAGDKPRTMHKYLPKKYQTGWADTTNYSVYTHFLTKQKNLHYIDFAGYTYKLADTSKIPLYPKFSLHWSPYTMYLAIDSLRKVVDNKLSGKQSAKPVLKGFEGSKEGRYLEYELRDLLNMYYSYANTENIYPVIEYQQPNGKDKPFIIQIGDSFGELLLAPRYFTSVFSDSSLVFRYNAIIKSYTADRDKNVNDINYWDYINRADAIVIVTSELNLDNLGMGFIEKAYLHYKGEESFFDYVHPFRVKQEETPEGLEYLITAGDNATYFKNRNFNVKAGKTYKLSFKGKGNGSLLFDLYPDHLPQQSIVFTNTWQNLSWNFTMPGDVPEMVLFRIYTDAATNSVNEFRLKDFKLEEVIQ
jgi:hypothetical protein